MEPFAIHALPVGIGTLALSPLPGRTGDYLADIKTLKKWRPNLLISLTEGFEMSQAGASSLGQDAQTSNCRWVHFPIKDFGTFRDADKRTWEEAQRLALDTLASGGRVLAHCRGGCGRSGMIVLRLMIAAGETPSKALARLRQVRPCAVETEAQLNWANPAQ
ncbi:hypothetical protein ROA7450_00981 [Roseovarius albus]|uniref:Tyrosine specific protein phosphatases domain-containing protein n=1 Tax=Roseovarius albus TaxID=1247867 RepID=A0A1X6YKX9_9RHOB|nr:dual specificity protein phosphatase family protein [Roseovarius albus]SLN24212.1 hypothetical protein ROA7450_00981 [Roseovarius albus]